MAKGFSEQRRVSVCVAVVSLFLLIGCGTARRTPLNSLDLKLSPVLDTTAHRDVFVGSDGKELGFVRYDNKNSPADIALVYLHGIESHAGWFKIAAEMLQAKGYDVFCLDRRGSGINRENRGFRSGHVHSYKTLFADIQSFIKPLQKTYQKIVLVGLSWGGRLGMGYALSHPEDIDGIILITPGLKSDLDVSYYAKIQIALAYLFRPKAYFALPIDPEMFTKTPKFLELIKSDPLRLQAATARFLIESLKLESLIDVHISKNEIPVFLLLTGHDRIINNAEVSAVIGRAWRSDVTRILYKDQIHSVQFDAPERLVDDMDLWIQNTIVKERLN